MPRWVGSIFLLLAAANFCWGIRDARRKRFFFIAQDRVSAPTYKIFSIFGFVLCLAGAFFVFFGPWPGN